MDELKKDEILEEAEETAAEELAAPEIASEDVETITEKEVTELKSELETELEELRDMFQKELDAQTNGTEGLVVPQSDDEAVDAEEEEFIPCDCCGENPRSVSFGEDYPYCDSCREAMKRYPLRFSGFLTLIISLALIVGTAYLSMPTIDSWIPALEGLMLFEEGKLYSAIESSFSSLNSAE